MGHPVGAWGQTLLVVCLRSLHRLKGQREQTPQFGLAWGSPQEDGSEFPQPGRPGSAEHRLPVPPCRADVATMATTAQLAWQVLPARSPGTWLIRSRTLTTSSDLLMESCPCGNVSPAAPCPCCAMLVTAFCSHRPLLE